MTIQRKLLTSDQKSDICPLQTWILGEHFCIYNLN